MGSAGASNGRIIVEEDAVAHAIAKVFARRRPRWEFKHSSLQALSYRSELRLFRRTKFFISLFGGALRFLPADCVVLEIQGAMKGETEWHLHKSKCESFEL